MEEAGGLVFYNRPTFDAISSLFIPLLYGATLPSYSIFFALIQVSNVESN